MNSKISNYLRIILFISIALFIGIVSIFFSTTNDPLNIKSVQTFDGEWRINVDNQSFYQASLPTTIDADPNDVIIVSKELSQEFSQEQMILIRGSLQSVIVHLDSEIIYEKDFEDNVFNTYASMYHFIEIPDNSEGKTIHVTLISPYENMSGIINSIYYGQASNIREFLVSNHGYKVITSLLLLSISLLYFFIHIIFFRKQNPYNSYLGLFGIIISLWLLAESRIIQLIIQNDFLIGSLAYLSLALAPIAFVAFLKSYIYKKDQYIYSSLCVVYAINLVLINFLHITNVADYFETVPITITLIVLGIIVTTVNLVHSLIKHKDKRFAIYLFLFLTFSLFMFLEVIRFANRDYASTATVATTGIVLVLVILFVVNIISLSRKIKVVYEKEIYEEIAKTDQLTKANSYYAFETDIDDLFYNEETKLSLSYFDFDDLKYINDHFGHLEGDKVLIDGYKMIQETFGQYGKCYRIGGDEFACLSTKIDLDLFLELKAQLTKLLKERNHNKPYALHISVGFSKQPKSKNSKPSDMILKADQCMYEDKAKNKAQVI